MSPLALAPAAALIAGAVVALVLEATGTPQGARKRLSRVHLPWLVAGWSAAAAVGVWLARGAGALDATSSAAIWAALALLTVTHASATGFLRSIDEERGELSATYLLFGAGVCAALGATHLLAIAAGLALAGVAGSYLTAPDREGPHGIEAAARLVFALGLVLALTITAAALTALAVGSVDLTALGPALGPPGGASPSALAVLPFGVALVLAASLLGAAPLQQRFVDVAHGAASSATGLLSGASLLLGGVLAVRVARIAHGDALHELLGGVALASLVGTPLAALAQVRVGRLVAYLAATQAGVIVAALAGATAADRLGDATAGVLVCAVAACAALLGVTLATRHPAATWEDWSGFGRARPVVAAVFIYALATCAGMPGTVGFLVRLSAARAAYARGDELLGLVCIASVAVAAAPVVRLALFLFAKTPSAGRGDADRPAVGFVVLVGACALLAAAPAVLDGLGRALDGAR